MALPATLRFCARTLERDVGFGADVFLSPATSRIAGQLRSAQVPSDLQRHEVGPSGEVLHLSSIGLPETSAPLPPQLRRSLNVGSDLAKRQRRAASERGAANRQPQARTAASDGVPWAAVLYGSGHKPGAARKLLADELRLPPSALRVYGGNLRSPGVSVQLVSLPRGAPHSAFQPGPLRSGILANGNPTVAVGEAPLTALLPPADTEGADGPQRWRKLPVSAASPAKAAKAPAPWRCEGHRYTVVVRNLDPRQVDGGDVEDAVLRLREEGFVNLFELPSFGFTPVRRYEIGAALWGGRWDLAARLLLVANAGLEPGHANEDEPCVATAAAAAASAFARGDLAKGVELLPDHAEGLRRLALELLHGRPALEALHAAVPLPVWSRSLASVAQLAWNAAAAARIAEETRRLSGAGADSFHKPKLGDLIWDADAGQTRPISAKELMDRDLSEIVIPVPKRGEPIPECAGRLRMEAILQRLVPGDDAPASAFPREVNTSLPAVRHLIATPTDVSWDIADSAADGEPVVQCDLAQLGMELARPRAKHVTKGRGRRSAGANRPDGPALRLRFSLPRGSGSADAVVRELLRANPSEYRGTELQSEEELF